jgi:hypothetical protein
LSYPNKCSVQYSKSKLLKITRIKGPIRHLFKTSCDTWIIGPRLMLHGLITFFVGLSLSETNIKAVEEEYGD